MQKHSLWNDRETILFLTYDENNLYLMAICKDENDQPAGKKHDDELHRGDAIEIFIDGIGDHKQYLEIQINSRNLNAYMEKQQQIELRLAQLEIRKQDE